MLDLDGQRLRLDPVEEALEVVAVGEREDDAVGELEPLLLAHAC